MADLERVRLNLGKKRLGLLPSAERTSFSTAVDVVAVFVDALVDGRGLLEILFDSGEVKLTLELAVGRIRFPSRFRTEFLGVLDAFNVELLDLFCAVLPGVGLGELPVFKKSPGIGDRLGTDPSLSDAGGVERSTGSPGADELRRTGNVLVKGRFRQGVTDRMLAGRGG